MKFVAFAVLVTAIFRYFQSDVMLIKLLGGYCVLAVLMEFWWPLKVERQPLLCKPKEKGALKKEPAPKKKRAKVVLGSACRPAPGGPRQGVAAGAGLERSCEKVREA